MEELVFDDIAKNVLNDWIGNVNEEKNESKNNNSELYSHDDKRNNYGLGYETTVKNNKNKEILQERLSKKNKKNNQNKNSSSGNDRNIEITHGIVEEEILSKISTKKNKNSNDKKRKLNDIEIDNQNTNNQQNKSKKVATITNPPLTTIENNPTTPTTTTTNEEGEKKTAFLDRKKVKTRSKQKNIKRDKRAAEFKPSHLVIGSKDYQGRPLTQVCSSYLFLFSFYLTSFKFLIFFFLGN